MKMLRKLAKCWCAGSLFISVAVSGNMSLADEVNAADSPAGGGWVAAKVERSNLSDAVSAVPHSGKPRRGSSSKKAPAASTARDGAKSQGASPPAHAHEPRGTQTNQAPPTAGQATPASNATAPQVAAPAIATPAAEAATKTSSPEYNAAVQKFCANIGPAASDARIAWQRRMLAEIESDIEARIARLEAKIAEQKEWLAKREEFAAKAGAALVQVFARMKPDTAAQQLAQMDEQTAAAVLLKLEPKVAAPLLDEVPPAKAAQLSAILAAGAGSFNAGNSKVAGQGVDPRPASAAEPATPASAARPAPATVPKPAGAPMSNPASPPNSAPAPFPAAAPVAGRSAGGSGTPAVKEAGK